MKKILPENPGFASAQSALRTVLKDQALMAARKFAAEANTPMEDLTVADEALDFDILGRPPTPEEEARRDREERRRGLEIQEGFEILRARRARARPSPARRTHTPARIRARRSPASTRRATTDSGGDDGGGDPEPPHRPHIYSLGGAL